MKMPTMKTMLRAICRNDSICEKFLKEINHKEYKSAICPSDIKRMKIGKCFDASIMAALRSGGKYKYVEGVAMFKDHTVLHGWVTDGVHAFDPTWRATDKTGKEVVPPYTYRGLEMDTKKVAKFVYETEYCGVYANKHRSPKLANALLKIKKK